ncbi:class I SAM-dependent methyltransferase [Marinimicrobium agarilyticum]|uniref:class I SAM-dependent methyltransferase n=1 Tax=Marinimicrobium agarilyticum TaxID=306546 RepID=UPI0003F81F73|nr:class I SAM-dependent methyltransferase [Marinimicrobium agarilyticum]
MIESSEEPPLVVISLASECQPGAARAARELGVPLLINAKPDALDSPAFALVYDTSHLALYHTGRKVPGPVFVDFLRGAVDHRRRFGGGKGQMIGKAVGLKAHVYPSVLDVTAGLGRDAFVLATLGCSVRMRERSALVYRLLEDGLARARAGARLNGDAELVSILERLTLEFGEGQTALSVEVSDHRPDVVYLDPMFPERQKSADVKKEMQAFHRLIGADADADDLLAPALAAARYRVVVKRPRKAPDLAGRSPSHRVEGKSSRFDVYALQKLPERLNDPEPGGRA